MYTVITYTDVGTTSWTAPAGITSVRTLVVAGGGGGGRAGGGGGGGMIDHPAYSMTPGTTYTVTVGDGGRGHTGDGSSGKAERGGDSVFGSLTAKGGGAGSNCYTINTRDGGSGGGAGFCSVNNPGSATQPNQPGDSGTYGYGYPGGLGYNVGGNGAGGGGGGAGNPGEDAFSRTIGADGGIGRQSDITGSNVYYAGGGGGSSHQAGASGGSSGGLGGGGGGSGMASPFTGTPAVDNIGGGGAAWHYDNAFHSEMDGGSGIVIIMY